MLKIFLFHFYQYYMLHGFYLLAPKNAVCNHGEIIQDSSDVSCRSFYLCSHGHRMLMTCAPGTMFDPKCLCCNHMTMVSCSTAAASIMKGKIFNRFTFK